MKLNESLLRRVAAHIIEEPNRLCMAYFAACGVGGTLFVGDRGRLQEFPSCATVGCIAGWAHLLAGRSGCSFFSSAKRALRLTKDQAQALFYNEEWPRPFAQRYRRARTQRSRAKIAVERIEHLIKTGK